MTPDHGVFPSPFTTTVQRQLQSKAYKKARLTSVIVRGVFLEVASLGKVLDWSSRGFPPALAAGDHRALKAGAGHRRSVILFDVAWSATSPSLEEKGCLQQLKLNYLHDSDWHVVTSNNNECLIS